MGGVYLFGLLINVYLVFVFYIVYNNERYIISGNISLKEVKYNLI